MSKTYDINWRRFIRLAVVALTGIVVVYLVLQTLAAGIYVYFLSHPGCIVAPVSPPDYPPHDEIILQNADGLRLRAWYYPPQNGVALLALGGPGGSLGSKLPPVKFLLDAGYGILQIDNRNCALDQANRPGGAAAPVTIGAREILDAQAGMEWLLARPEVQKVGATGFSMGGATAIMTAARHPEISAVVADGGYYNIGLDFVEPEKSKPLLETLFLYTVTGFHWAVTGVNPFKVSPVEDLPKISPRPVLLIYGDREIHSGRGDIQYAAAREPKELWIVPGGTHGTNHIVAQQEYERRVLAFLEQAFKQP